MNKTPSGFRAVRMRGKTEVVYCVDRAEQAKMNGINKQEVSSDVDVYAADGSELVQCTTAQFNAMFTREHSPMPDAVRAMFDDKPTFSEWWAQMFINGQE